MSFRVKSWGGHRKYGMRKPELAGPLPRRTAGGVNKFDIDLSKVRNRRMARTTPVTTQPIKSFTVEFEDGGRLTVLVGNGNGHYRQEHFQGTEKQFPTYECFITDGTVDEG